LKQFLVERYVLFSRRDQQLFSGRVYHTPYQVQGAKIEILREKCLQAAGFSRPDHAPHALYSSGVDVEVWPLERC
jgi:uncharacterized protein YqjF (DUF2071 family)